MNALLTLFFIGLNIAAFAGQADGTAQIGGLEIKHLTLPEAIAVLNKRIAMEHPGKLDLLVAYVEAPFPIVPLGEGEIDKEIMPPSKKRFDLSFNKPITIRLAVKYLTDLTMCHYRAYDGVIVVYGWHYPDFAIPPSRKSNQAEQAGAGQPTTKPADKPSVKDQPSTPTPKDRPR